jgi:uncharacterized protein (TIGR02118 family)
MVCRSVSRPASGRFAVNQWTQLTLTRRAAAFDDHYRTTHIPLAREVRRLSAYMWGKCAPIGGSPTPYYVVANLYFRQHRTYDLL